VRSSWGFWAFFVVKDRNYEKAHGLQLLRKGVINGKKNLVIVKKREREPNAFKGARK